jgi:hypothetical protein
MVSAVEDVKKLKVQVRDALSPLQQTYRAAGVDKARFIDMTQTFLA